MWLYSPQSKMLKTKEVDSGLEHPQWGFSELKIFVQDRMCDSQLSVEIPGRELRLLVMFVLMIMSGMGVAGAQAHLKHSDSNQNEE